ARPARALVVVLEAAVLVVQAVAELLALGGEVALVLGVRVDDDRELLRDCQTVALQAGQLLGVVRQDPNRAQAEVGEDLVADPPLSRIGRIAELEVRLDRVEPALLQLVRLQLRKQADAAALLRHVEEDAALLRLDPLERELELVAAVAAERVEDVAGQTLGVHADEDVLRAVDLALHERDVRLAGARLLYLYCGAPRVF